jgi:hypothetical protein
MVDVEKAGDAAKAPADIHCGFCGTRNPGGAAVCSQCGGDLKQGTRRKTGQVLGAFSAESAPAVSCPNCGTANPAAALKCATCGASLASQPAVPAAKKTPGKGVKLSPFLIALMALGVILLVVGCLAVINRAGQTEEVIGTVADVSWTTSLVIEAYQPVDYSDWKDEIPSEGEIGSCEYRYATLSDEPEAVSTEVCGTSYIVDQGTGAGEVVQDCQYRVYAEYCEYTLTQWTQLEELTLQGHDRSPQEPAPVLGTNQRLGESTAAYTIVFGTDEGSYTYQTNDFSLFQQADLGSTWVLEIGGFNNIRSVKMQE